MNALRRELVGHEGIALEDDVVHPMRFYVVPPINEYTTGDVLEGPSLHPPGGLSPAGHAEAAGVGDALSDNADLGWYVLLTPA